MTATFQPTAAYVPFLIPADEPLAPCPVFASGIYFNNTYLVFVLNIWSDETRAGPLYLTRLTTYSYPIVANADGTYGFGPRTKAAVTPFSSENERGVASYAVVNCVRLVDTVYVFIADSSWQKVHVVAVYAQATPGTVSVGLHATLQLPNAAPGFVPAEIGGTLQLLYPDPVLSQINSLIYDPHSNTVTPAPCIPVGGFVAGPFTCLSVSDVPMGSGSLNLTFTDSNTNVWMGQVVNGSIFITPEQSGLATPAWSTDMKVGSGPMIGQPDQVSLVYFFAGTDTNNPINYAQAPLSNPFTAGQPSVLGDGNLLQHKVMGTFLNEAYVALPGTTSGLLRVLVYGAVLGGGLLWLYMIPTGQLFAQTPVVTDTSQTGGLTAAQKQAYEQSWTLLGIIQGPPPWVDNGSGLVTATTAQIEFSSTTGATSTITYGASVSIGGSASGDIFSFSGSASYALKQTTANSKTFSVDQTIQLSDSPANTGLVVVSQPTISNTEYQVYSPHGGTYLHFSLYLIEVTDVATTMFDFDITNPSAHTYSTGLTALPASSDLASWSSLTLPTLHLAPLLPPALTATEAADSTSKFSSTTSQDVTTSNKVSVSATFGVFGFSSTVGFSWSNSTKTSSSFTNSYESTIANIAVHNPVLSTDITRVEIQPYILQTSGATATQLSGLVPTLYAGSTPWILTWRVLSYSTQGAGTV